MAEMNGMAFSSTWLRPTISAVLPDVIRHDEADAAEARLERFAPVLAALFEGEGWDGRIRSELIDYPVFGGAATMLVKGDHALPMTGSIKARGGVHELLFLLESIAEQHDLLADGDYQMLAGNAARELFGRHAVIVASTGNLGYSIGLVARAFGLVAEVHMSRDAKEWKKARLRQLGATVVEHACDYTETVARARTAAATRDNAFFIDDENSRHLLTGYAAAGRELASQLEARGIAIGPERRLVVYLPCGVGGAPGGITYGLKRIFGANVVSVFVEPTASPCVLVAMATGSAHSVYDYGCDNDTIADGLAVPRASELVLAVVGDAIDAVISVSDTEMAGWVAKAWRGAGLRLEPSAAASFAAFAPFTAAAGEAGWPSLDNAVHVFWATGGSRLPDAEFLPLIEGAAVC